MLNKSWSRRFTLSLGLCLASVALADYPTEYLFRKEGSPYWETEVKTATSATFLADSIEVSCAGENGQDGCLFSGVTEYGFRSPTISLKSKEQALEVARLAKEASKNKTAIAFANGEFTDTKKPYLSASERLQQLEKRLDTYGFDKKENGTLKAQSH